MHFDPEINIAVASDASDYGIGAVLLHKYEDGSTKLTIQVSCSLIAIEKKYSQIDKEDLSIIFAVKKIHRFYTVEVFVEYSHQFMGHQRKSYLPIQRT